MNAKIFSGGLILLGLAGTSSAALAQAIFVQDGHAGFVVSHIEYALGKDAEETGACPDGMTGGMTTFEEIMASQQPQAGGATQQSGQDGQEQAGEASGQAQSDGQQQAAGGASYGQGSSGQASPQQQQGDEEASAAQAARVQRLVQGFPSVDGKNLCMHPELGEPDPNFKTISGPNVPAYGINLDGENSQESGQCAHNDFVGMNGETGIDNQFFRVVGCSPSFQSSGQSNTWATGMLTGSWGILMTLDGVDDIKNDDEVEVGIYANADPIQLSASREPLDNATYAIKQDPNFRTTTKGRIVDGVLTTEPADVKFQYEVNSIYLERPLHEARLQLTVGEDGALEGYLAGYASVDEMYNVQYGFRNGKDAAGNDASPMLKLISSNGQGAVQGHSCHGAYHALYAAADARPDPETGKCTWISTQYKLKAIPAFVVDEETQSANEELIK